MLSEYYDEVKNPVIYPEKTPALSGGSSRALLPPPLSSIPSPSLLAGIVGRFTSRFVPTAIAYLKSEAIPKMR